MKIRRCRSVRNMGHQSNCLNDKLIEDLLDALRFYANVAIVEDDTGEIARQAIAQVENKDQTK